MNIKKLGLASTLMVLSVTISLGSCDLLKSLEPIIDEKAERLQSIVEEKEHKDRDKQLRYDNALRNYNETEAKLKEEYDSDCKYLNDERYNKASTEYLEALKALHENNQDE